MVKNIAYPESCLLFATADWNEKYWTNKQHCAKSLAELGVRVIYIESIGLRNPKINSKKDWSRIRNRLKNGMKSLISGPYKVAHNIYVLSPLVIPGVQNNIIIKLINGIILKFLIQRSKKTLKIKNSFVWTYHPFMLDAIEKQNVYRLLYHCVDNIENVPGVNSKYFKKQEMRLIAKADTVFATALPLAERCKRINPNTHFLPNVADAEHFRKAVENGPLPEEIKRIPEPRLMYHGVLSDFKVDFNLLLKCAKMKKEWNWVLIGEEREGQNNEAIKEMRSLENVYFLGYKEYSEIPKYLRGGQLGLLPSKINQYTDGMFPMKYYEYISAGLSVVSTEIQFTNSIDFIYTSKNNPEEYIIQIQKTLDLNHNKRKISNLVKSGEWKNRTEKMLDILMQSGESYDEAI